MPLLNHIMSMHKLKWQIIGLENSMHSSICTCKTRFLRTKSLKMNNSTYQKFMTGLTSTSDYASSLENCTLVQQRDLRIISLCNQQHLLEQFESVLQLLVSRVSWSLCKCVPHLDLCGGKACYCEETERPWCLELLILKHNSSITVDRTSNRRKLRSFPKPCGRSMSYDVSSNRLHLGTCKHGRTIYLGNNLIGHHNCHTKLDTTIHKYTLSIIFMILAIQTPVWIMYECITWLLLCINEI